MRFMTFDRLCPFLKRVFVHNGQALFGYIRIGFIID